jgi:hypothetical protein
VRRFLDFPGRRGDDPVTTRRARQGTRAARGALLHVVAPRSPMIAIIGNVVTGLAALGLFRATLSLRKR